MENTFNLIDEPWIPVADFGQASLKQIFSNYELTRLGGNSVQKIALTKLLLAIAQAACTPKDQEAWAEIGWEELAKECLNYLDQNYDRFYLYGDHPFLQMPAVAAAQIKPLGALSPEISTGNTTVLTESQVEKPLTDAEKALIIVVQMGFGLSGKKVDNSVVLTKGYTGKLNPKGKPASGKAGIAMGHMGLLHSYWLVENIAKTIWLNLFTQEDIDQSAMYEAIGQAPWENMPEGEDDAIANKLSRSLMGRLVPLGKFCLLAEEGVHFSDGIAHSNYLEGKVDPTVSIDFFQKKPKALWVNPNKRPWRELTSILQFVETNKNSGFETLQLAITHKRVKSHCEEFALWSGGLRVSSNAGEQYASGTDNYVESELWLNAGDLGSYFLEQVKTEMANLEKINKILWGAVSGYFRKLSDIDKSPSGKPQAFVSNQSDRASGIFWTLCERRAQELIDACDTNEGAEAKRKRLRKQFCDNAHGIFNQLCPSSSARQMDAWAETSPNFSKEVSGFV